MKFYTKTIGLTALLGCLLAGTTHATEAPKYVVAKKENDSWIFVGLSDTQPTFQPDQEILALPSLQPAFDPSFNMDARHSPYGGYDCQGSDKSAYTPCTSGLYRFVGANWFGLGGIRVGMVNERYFALRSAVISQSETVASILKKAEDEEKARQVARNKSAEQARAQAAAESSKRAAEQRKAMVANLQKMAKLERGMEDRCTRNTSSRAVVQLDPDYEDISCQFGGAVQLAELPSAGWMVVSKMRDRDGVVTEYIIRKAR